MTEDHYDMGYDDGYGHGYSEGAHDALNTYNVTRLVIIDHRTGGEGIVLEKWNIGVEIMELQDEGRTLKIRMIDGHV